MNEKKMEGLQRGRYIESFDSVLHTPKEGRKYNLEKQHAEIELLISLLFGEPMVVPEPYSFDSLGFLDIATNILEKRIKNKKNPISKPFILALRPIHTSFKDMIAKYFTRPGLILSGWPEINDNFEFRKYFANLIQKGEYKKLSKSNDLNDRLRENIEEIKMLNRYFSSKKGPIISAMPPTFELKECINWVIKTEPDIFKDKLEIDYESFQNLKSTLVDIEKEKGMDFFNDRSAIRFFDRSAVMDGVIEFIDTCYNRVVSSSVGQSIPNYSSIFSAGKSVINPYVKIGEKLPHIYDIEENRYSSDKINLEINTDEKLQKKLLPINWEYIWEILNDRSWIESIKKFHLALSLPSSDENRTHVDELLDAHIKLLEKNLASINTEIILDKKHVKIIRYISGSLLGLGGNIVLTYTFGIPFDPRFSMITGRFFEKLVTPNVLLWYSEGSINLHRVVKIETTPKIIS